MQTIKTVGKSGQISLGRAMAGMNFIMQELPGGDLILKRTGLVPETERWLHQPDMKEKLAHADHWMRDNPACETDLDQFDATHGIGA